MGWEGETRVQASAAKILLSMGKPGSVSKAAWLVPFNNTLTHNNLLVSTKLLKRFVKILGGATENLQASGGDSKVSTRDSGGIAHAETMLSG